MKRFLLVSLSMALMASSFSQPVSLLPGNPHYFLYKDKPLILITSAEHYGAVVNRKFDYNAYFDWLASYGLNYTRIYPGYLTEPPDKWIKGNTLGLRSDEIILPWKRSNEPGYAMGGNKFDLDQWDEEYFQRLKDFIQAASKRDIIVEICFFNAQYSDCWPICPLYYKNNIQGTGNCNFNSAQTLDDMDLAKREADYVAHITREVNDFDNVILELCDEPTINGTSPEKAGRWLDYLINTVVSTEKELPKKHLVAQQVEGDLDGPCDFSADPRISIVTCQYAYWSSGEQLGGLNGLKYKYNLNKPVELNETYYYPVWFKEDSIGDSRVEAWEFIVGGGGAFNHLNGVYTNENPSGNTPDNKKLCNSLKVLKDFMYSLEFTKMKPDKEFVRGLPDEANYRGMSEEGKQYALYIHYGRSTDFSAFIISPGNYRNEIMVRIPSGKYKAEWVDPSTGEKVKTVLKSKGEELKLTSPVFTEDIALKIKRIQ